MLAEIISETLKLDLTDIAYRTFYDQNNRLNEKIHLFWDENLHDRISEDGQLNSSLDRIMNVFVLYARVITTDIPEGSIQYVEFQINKKKNNKKMAESFLYLLKDQVSRLIEGIEKIIESLDNDDLHKFLLRYFKGFYTDFIHFSIIQFLLAQDSFRKQFFTT